MSGNLKLITHVQGEDREAATRPLSLRLIVRLFGYARPYRLKRNTLFALVLVRAVQLPCLAWLIGAVLGGPVAAMNTRGVLLGAAAYGLLAALTQLTLRYRSRFGCELGEDVICDLRKAMFGAMQRLPMSFYQKTRLGRVISRFTSDSEAVRLGIQNILYVSMVLAGQMVVAAGFMIWYDAVLFLVVVGMTPVLWALNRYFGRKLSTAYRAVQESFSRVTATLAESVGGVRVTQGFVREKVNADLFHELISDHSQYNIDASSAAGVFIPMLEFNAQCFVALVLFIGGWRVLHGYAGIEDLYQFILMANVFFAPIQSLGSQYNDALTAMAGAERVFGFLDTKPEWSDPPDATVLTQLRGRVDFENVSFAYNEGKPVLRDINFKAEPGQTVALVGHTGSGKSTLMNLISKFYLPGEGRLLLDGRDIRSIETASLRRQMGIVLQENFLFSGTVMDNILVGKPDATREDAIQAAKKLDCLDLIAAMPDGFSTVVGERGIGISLGQRQLICFARAMLADPRILILDEATSSVDAMTEARIQKALATLLSNRTSFVAAHRLSTIRHADIVLVLDKGRIAERGTHWELLTAGGIYADLYRDFIRSAEA